MRLVNTQLREVYRLWSVFGKVGDLCFKGVFVFLENSWIRLEREQEAAGGV